MTSSSNHVANGRCRRRVPFANAGGRDVSRYLACQGEEPQRNHLHFLSGAIPVVACRALSVFERSSRQAVTLYVIRQRAPLQRQLLISALRKRISRRRGFAIALLCKPAIFLWRHQIPNTDLKGTFRRKLAEVAAARQAPALQPDRVGWRYPWCGRASDSCAEGGRHVTRWREHTNLAHRLFIPSPRVKLVG
jgi:hypothetical protein